jgi:hypothetical protein
LRHLETEVTVEDPGVLPKPFTLKRDSEFICAETERDGRRLIGT